MYALQARRARRRHSNRFHIISIQISIDRMAGSALVDAVDHALSEKLMLGKRQKLSLAREACRVRPGRSGTPFFIWMSAGKQLLRPRQDQLGPFVHLSTPLVAASAARRDRSPVDCPEDRRVAGPGDPPAWAAAPATGACRLPGPPASRDRPRSLHQSEDFEGRQYNQEADSQPAPRYAQ